jgi:hypothetical protein
MTFEGMDALDGGGVESVGIVLGVVVAVGLYLQRRATHTLLASQDARIAALVDDLDSLKAAMIADGAAERGAKLPPPPSTKPSSSRTRRVEPAKLLAQADPAEPVSETTEQIRARLEREEDERDQARGRGELGELATLAADRPSEGQTQVFSAAAARLAAQAPHLPKAADEGEDLDELTQVRSREPAAADVQIPGVPVVPTPASRPVTSLAAALRLARTDPDQRPTIEAPAPSGTAGPAAPADLAQTMMSAGASLSSRSPGVDGAAKLDEEVAHQFSLRIAAVARSGQNLSHCAGSECTNDPRGACACPCERCRRRRRVLAQVQLEVRGPTLAQRRAAGRRHGELVAKLHGEGQRVAHCNGVKCRPPPQERASEVDNLLPEESCVCSCAGCDQMRRLLKRAFGQVADEAVR